jgi:PPOX class probable F420-dependent enzyme
LEDSVESGTSPPTSETGMEETEALRRLAGARVGRLATADPEGVPHVVPFVFALAGRTLYWAVDRKPKRSPRLRRLDNIRANPRVEVVVDHYDEDWTGLWWVRASGAARFVDGGEERSRALRSLVEKYPQYGRDPPEGPVVAIDLDRCSGWSAR